MADQTAKDPNATNLSAVQPSHTSTPVNLKIVPMNRITTLTRKKLEDFSDNNMSGIKIYEDLFESTEVTYENASVEKTLVYKVNDIINDTNASKNTYEIMDVNNEVIAKFDLVENNVYFV